MKLLLCTNCTDIFSLDLYEKTCSCGLVKGKYINGQLAEYSGKSAFALGFANNSFINALINQPEQGMGREFTAFVIPKSCPTFIKITN
ncbi:hypothetical protein J2S09_004112 [Bacillus fengqiuensis]|nr:hypothetical protein [Bacillus fengqiuensis]